ncbi:MAG: KOW domain-containing RNA-binding protein [Ruminococcus sp.]|nr:KOW domain-containing RNA-binding protein [Ruminococcus sp.]
MDIKKGQIVTSKAGHDGGRFFIVTDVKDGYVYLSDGKERKLNAPKKKNIKHIAKTNTVEEIPKTDKSLRKLLNNFSRFNQED